MLPIAYVAHNVEDRTRLRIPSRKGDAAFFAGVERALAACEGVAYVETNPMTGSVLLRHTAPIADLTSYALEHQLFTLQPYTLPANTVLNTVSDRLDQAERTLQQMTHGAFDLNELLFVGLLGAVAVQVLRGKTLGPASALLSYAAAVLAVHRAKRAAQ
jgi:hypothetical protein